MVARVMLEVCRHLLQSMRTQDFSPAWSYGYSKAALSGAMPAKLYESLRVVIASFRQRLACLHVAKEKPLA